MDKRARLNRQIFLSRELRDEEIPDDQRKLLEGMERERTWKPFPLKYAGIPALILTGFIFYILFLGKLWIWMLGAPLPGAILFLVLYFNSPTICVRCNREMDYYRPIHGSPHKGYIVYDYCNSCKAYCNLHWTPETRDQ